MAWTKLRSSSKVWPTMLPCCLSLSCIVVSTVQATTGLEHLQSSIEFNLMITDRLSGASLQALSLPGTPDHLVYLHSHVDSEHFLSLSWRLHKSTSASANPQAGDTMISLRGYTPNRVYMMKIFGEKWEYKAGNDKQQVMRHNYQRCKHFRWRGPHYHWNSSHAPFVFHIVLVLGIVPKL